MHNKKSQKHGVVINLNSYLNTPSLQKEKKEVKGKLIDISPLFSHTNPPLETPKTEPVLQINESLIEQMVQEEVQSCLKNLLEKPEMSKKRPSLKEQFKQTPPQER